MLKTNSLKKISDEVEIVKIDDKKYIYKKIIMPVTIDEEIKKQEFIEFLYQNNIKVARVLECYLKEDGNIFELQEYIESENREVNLNEVVEALANFHKVSKKWDKIDFNKKMYNMKSFCCNIELDKILLGFEEKYSKYPIENYMKNKKILSRENVEEDEFLVKKLKCFVEIFCRQYDTCSCICHNDFTSNNWICGHDGIFLIDFDFSIKTSEYVDFVDAILSRNSNLQLLCCNFETIKNEVYTLLQKYNEINNRLDLKGVLLMMAIKIISFNLYINFNQTNIANYKANQEYIIKLTKLIQKEIEI